MKKKNYKNKIDEKWWKIKLMKIKLISFKKWEIKIMKNKIYEK